MTTENELVELLDHTSRLRTLQRGEVLCAQNDTSTDAFVVRAGSIEAVIERAEGDIVVAVHGPGALVGEITALIGGRRTATLRASTDATVGVISSEDLRAAFEAHAETGATLLARARERTDRSRVASMLAQALSADGDQAIAEIAERVSWVDLSAGGELFAEGDDADAAYLVVSGRLLVSNHANAALAEIGRGEIVGEFGLIEGRGRTATVTALRDTALARLTATDFADLNERHTALAMGLVRRVLDRASSQLNNAAPAGRSVALVLASPDGDSVVEPFFSALADLGPAFHLAAHRVDAMLNQPGIANIAVGAFGDVRLAELFQYAESNYEQILLEATADDSAWTARAVRQADIVVVACSPHQSTEEAQRTRQLVASVPDGVQVWLMLLHPPTTSRPAGTATLIESFGVAEAHHVAEFGRGLGRRTVDDIGRIARLAAGRGTGLVLGGGGARGFAHIGVIQSLEECGVPIDRIAGASMGAVIAAGYAQDLAPDERSSTLARQVENLLDYTIPVVSLIKAERISDAVTNQYGGWDIPDLWVPFSCVSTNLTTSKVITHREGPADRAVRASLSLPGIMPPVVHGDDLLVDGGILNNLPVDVMADDPSIGTIVACDVTPPFGPRAKTDHGLSMSGWTALRAKVGRGVDPYPGLGGVLMRSMLLGSTRDRDRHVESGAIDLYLDLDLRGVNLLDFEVVDPVVEKGYAASRERVAAWVQERQKAKR